MSQERQVMFLVPTLVCQPAHRSVVQAQKIRNLSLVGDRWGLVGDVVD